MGHQAVEITFDGPNAEQDAGEFAALLSTELPGWDVTTPRSSPSSPSSGQRGLPVAIAIIALILATPAAVKHSLDVADRLQLAEKFARLREWAKQRRARRLKVPVVVLPPSVKPVPLDQATPDQFLEALVARPKQPPK